MHLCLLARTGAAVLIGGLLAAVVPAVVPAVALAAPALPQVELARGMQPEGSADAVTVAGPAAAARAGSPTMLASSATMQAGIDIASYQHPNDAAIDWRQVAASGQSFVVVKATEAGYVNPWFARDISGAHAAGMVVGGYAFARPAYDAGAQADAFAQTIGRLPAPALPPVLDLEDTGGLSVGALQNWTRTFVQRVQAVTGIAPMIYTGPYFWSTAMGGTREFNQYPLWEAHYTGASAPQQVGGWPTYTLWQYSSTGSVPGIASAVDQNRFLGTRADLEAVGRPASAAGPGQPSSVGAPANVTAGAKLGSPSGQYTFVVQGDGNVVVYGNGRALWWTGTGGHPGATLSVQSDGNVVVYDRGRALWSTGTAGAGGGQLILQDDGNLVLYTARGAAWNNGSPGADVLTSGGVLTAGQALISRDGRSTTIMQNDGNLVVYVAGRVQFASNTAGWDSSLRLQSDGNLVIYDYRNVAMWTSYTQGSQAGLLWMQSDSNLVLYGPAGAVFASAS